NYADCAQTITVNATTVPTIICPGPLTVNCTSVPMPDTSLVTASDGCGGSAVMVSFVGDLLSASNNCFNQLVITRTYRATDPCGNSAECGQTITVLPINHAPLAINDAYSVNEDTLLSIAAPGLLANDTDPDGDSLTANVVTAPAHGSLTLNADGSL